MKVLIPRSAFGVGMAATTLLVSDVNASKKFVAMIPNGGNVPDTPAIGHTDGTGDDEATNAFGDAFAAAGKKWTKELCEADTDGDGQTNGQELGDPCCEWTQGAQPSWTTGVSHPSDASKTSDPSLWANMCGASSPATATSSGAAASATTTASSTTRPPTASATTSSTAATGSSSVHDAEGSMAQMSNSSTPASSDHNHPDDGNSIEASTHDGSESLSSSSSSVSFDIEPQGDSSKSNNVGSAGGDSSAAASIPTTSSSKAGSTASSTSAAAVLNPVFLTTASVLAAVMVLLA